MSISRHGVLYLLDRLLLPIGKSLRILEHGRRVGSSVVLLLRQADKPRFVMSAGTGGCFSGNSEVFKDQLGNVKCVAVEPASSRHLSKGTLGGHRIEGIGPGFIPKIMRMDLVDRIIPVSDEDAYSTARQLGKTEGVFGGSSSGANVFAALQLAP